jgi:DNA-binding response OmpR family regulator
VKKILVVDDQVSVRRLIEMTLVGKGLEVIQADSGEQAVVQARADAPDLVIMDVMMPGGMDGYATIAALRDLSCDCPVLILTGKDQQSERDRARVAGGDAYLPKPFRLHELLEVVESLLGGTA